MKNHIVKSLWLLGATVVICCLIYPLAVWAIGQTFFPVHRQRQHGQRARTASRSGSLLIAQPFTKDEYFWPRPSAASYDGSASASSTLAASNYMLRDRVAQQLGPIVKYKSGPKAGQLVAPDIEAWFQQDSFGGQPHIVAQWADNHNAAGTGMGKRRSDACQVHHAIGPRLIRPKWRIGSSRIPALRSRKRPIWR